MSFTLATINQDLLDRLVNVNKENTKLKRVFRHQPSIDPTDYVLPYTYFRLMESDTIPNDNAGILRYTQDVRQRVVVAPVVTTMGLDGGDRGNAAEDDAHILIDVVRTHYLARKYLEILGGIHPDLPTAQAGILDVLELEHRCLGVRFAPELNKNWYVVFDYILNVPIVAVR